jgi:hypothetical protein
LPQHSFDFQEYFPTVVVVVVVAAAAVAAVLVVFWLQVPSSWSAGHCSALAVKADAIFGLVNGALYSVRSTTTHTGLVSSEMGCLV